MSNVPPAIPDWVKVGRRSRRKGNRGEQLVCRIMRRHGWPDAERTSNGRTQTGRGDVAKGPAGCYFEVRFREALSVPKAFAEAHASALPTETPILVHKRNEGKLLATLELEELLPLLALRERG